MGKTREDGVGNEQAAWNTLEKKYNSNTKEARRAYHEYLHNTKMKSGDVPDDFLYTMNGYRERLEDMGQPVPDERYEDIILQAFPAEYERVRTASYERRDFPLADIRRMMSALYVDCLSRLNNSPSVMGRGVAMHLTGGGDRPINCHYCGNPGHRQKNCVACTAAQRKERNQHATHSKPFRRWRGRKRGENQPMWCSFHNSSTHSDETCRTQKQQMGDIRSAKYASQKSDYQFAFFASDRTPRSNVGGQGISFAAVEVPTRDEPTKEQGFGPFGPTDEPVASFDTSGWFSGSGGANSEETEGSIFEIEEGPIRRLGLWSYIFDTLTSLARHLVMAFLLHYAWFTFDSSLTNRVASTNTNGQPVTFCSITTVEDGLVDNGASDHSFDNFRFTGLRYKLQSYQALAIRRWITTAGGHQLKRAVQGLLRGHSIGIQGLNRMTQLTVLARPDVGRDFYSFEQDGALPGGESLVGIPEGGKPPELLASLGEASPARRVPQGGVLEHYEQPMSHGCEHVEAALAGPLPLQHYEPSHHQVAPSAARAGSATQSMRERNDNDCTHLVETATDSTLSPLRRPGLYIEALLRDNTHQTDEAESVVEYACAATNGQLYSVGNETEVVPNTFEGTTIVGSRWVYKISAENSIGQPRLVPTALERLSPLRRGTVTSAPEK